MRLSEVFTEVAYKELAQVDLPDQGSHQHELNGSSALRRFFNTSEKLSMPISWYYFADNQEPLHEIGGFTFYDARAKSNERTGRTEWRGYYTGDFLANAAVGDALLLARIATGQLFGLVFQINSGWLRSAQALFNLDIPSARFVILPEQTLGQQELALKEQLILEELGFEVIPPAQPRDEDLMVAQFGMMMPKTKELSAFARAQIEVDINDPDATLGRWIERETSLFFSLERLLVQRQLDAGFDSVQHFISYSISIQQSRKSRMGHSLQNQLEALFTAYRLKFKSQCRTEGKNKPDFIFPGEAEYHDPDFDSALLVMLGVKSTVKDRWRQVLTEADRIMNKHLCTLEPGISSDQTDEMRRKQLILVIPQSLFSTYTDAQQREMLNLSQFIKTVRDTQS